MNAHKSTIKLPEGGRPVLLVVMDGVGWTPEDHRNAVLHANISCLRRLSQAKFRTLKAHGKAVGLPSDGDMGNSEVGHNALGCGQIYAQGAKLVNESIASGDIFRSEAWKEAVSRTKKRGTLHFIGLLSDGNVHSHIDHLKALISKAKDEGVQRVAVHALFDGRDVEDQSALLYVADIERFMNALRGDGFDAFIASGGGRMNITMDRYEADWSMVERGWHAHVLGDAAFFPSAEAAVTAARAAEPDISDQYLPAFVVEKEGKALAPVLDGDSVILFNFRGDRALEISRAFEEEDFTAFDRVRKPAVYYAGLLEYDGDLHIPSHYLVQPPKIKNTLTETLIKAGIAEYAVSETQKFGHVTYFWNGNRQEKFSEELETWSEIPSDTLSFDLKPWMKAYEITEAVIAAMRERRYGFIRCNYPNGDMVGHTGNYDAAVVAIESVDLSLARLLPVCEEEGYTLIVLADHGNCDEMVMEKNPAQPKTSHTLSPVPLMIWGADDILVSEREDMGLANVAAGVALLLGTEPHPDWEAPAFYPDQLAGMTLEERG